MAPAQKNIEMCGEEMHSELKISPVTYKNGKGAHFENNNTVLRDSASEVTSDSDFDIKKYEAMEFKAQWRWPDLLAQVFLHLVSIYGLYLMISNQVKLYTILFGESTIFSEYNYYLNYIFLLHGLIFRVRQRLLRPCPCVGDHDNTYLISFVPQKTCKVFGLGVVIF